MDQEPHHQAFERAGQIVSPLNQHTPERPAWLQKRSSSIASSHRRRSSERRRSITRAPHGKHWWKFTLRPWDDDQQQDWWFAGTAIPLLAATLAPLANVLSIAALITYWRMCLVDGVDPESCPWDGGELLTDLEGHTYKDPHWCYALNIVSLVLGFIGNLFLLFNFTNRVRYIIALPVTIFLWYVATGILIGITISMNQYVPPTGPQQIYTQGFWYAVIAAILYLVCSMLLMVNMLGYFLGHYPQRFNLTDSQRTLILQTMLFFIWLAGGAGVFSTVESRYGEHLFDWTYVNALYFCDVTILTVGFGDLYPTSDVGRGLVLPYSVAGIIMLGLVISSITKFATELGEDKILQKHIERSRQRTIGRSVTSSLELKERPDLTQVETRPTISGPFNPVDRSTSLRIIDNKVDAKQKANNADTPIFHVLRRTASLPLTALRKPRSRLLVLREEKDRFDAMRRIEHSTLQWKRWYALFVSVTAFGILWCIGALIFWVAERDIQGLSYFESLYLCYVSLLTIGYGDLAPKSNAGRPFFVVWSLVAVPTMTILIADMGDTVISGFKQGTFRIADFTILPKAGIWKILLTKIPWLYPWLQRRKEEKAASKRINRGFEIGIEEKNIEGLAKEKKLSDTELARKLARAIRSTADDLGSDPPRRYSYEEWVEITTLIRFSSSGKGEDGDEGLIEWDWIGEDSPLMAQESEAEFVLDRLCESMNRYLRRLEDKDEDEGRDSGRELGGEKDEVEELDDAIAEA